MKLPLRGQMWRHYKGELYEIIGTGIDTESGSAVVVYWLPTTLAQDERDPKLFSRRLDIFLGYTADHKHRFKLERDRP